MLRKFTRLIISQARFLPVNTLIIGGLQDEDEVIPQLEGSLISYVAHLESDEFREAVQKGGIVICRSGYSGIMDLAALNRTAVLIPTPGQTEQEYLASYLAERGMFESVIQSEMDLNNMADKIKKASSDQWYQIFNTEDIPVYPLFQEKNN
jgi:UDP-N-acetylglucosamine:LPS N-acetylglucosamine transferase